MTRRSARLSLPANADLERVTHSRLRLLGVALICLHVALVPLVFDVSADIPFTVTKGLVAHSLAYLLMGVMGGLFTLYGRSVIVWSPIHVPVLAFLVVASSSTLFAANNTLGLFGAHVRMLGLGTIAAEVALYFAIVVLVRTRLEALAVVAAGLGAALLVLAYEGVQFAGKDPLTWSASSAVRPFSTLGQTTTLAEYLTVLALGTATVALFERRLRVPMRVALLGFVVVLIAGVVVTQTRAAVIGIVAGAALVVVLTWTAHSSRRARFLSMAGAFAASVAITLVLLFSPLGVRILGTVDVEGPDIAAELPTVTLAQSADARLALYRIALAMLKERPVLGYGPDNFSVGVPRYRTASEPTEIQQSLATSAHSWLAQLAATTGVLGLAAFLGTIFVALVLVLRKGFHPALWGCAAMLVAFLGAGLTTIDDLSTNWLFWAALAGIAVLSVDRQRATEAGHPSRPTTHARKPRLPMTRVFGAAICVLAGGLLAATTWSAFSASHLSRDASQSRLAGRYPQAIALSLRATSSDSARPEYWEGLGLGYVGAQRFGEAVTAFQRASHLAPHDIRYLGEVARAYAVLAQKGDVASGTRAREVAEQGVRLDPNNPQAQLTRAVVMQVTGDLPQALQSVERALELDPATSNRELFLTATQVLLANGKAADAIGMARRAIAVLPNPQDTVQIRIELARALVAYRQPALAITELDAALAIQPNDPAALQLRSQIRSSVPVQ